MIENLYKNIEHLLCLSSVEMWKKSLVNKLLDNKWKKWGKKQMFMKKKVTCISFLLHFWGSNETNPTKLTHQLFFLNLFIY